MWQSGSPLWSTWGSALGNTQCPETSSASKSSLQGKRRESGESHGTIEKKKKYHFSHLSVHRNWVSGPRATSAVLEKSLLARKLFSAPTAHDRGEAWTSGQLRPLHNLCVTRDSGATGTYNVYTHVTNHLGNKSPAFGGPSFWAARKSPKHFYSQSFRHSKKIFIFPIA